MQCKNLAMVRERGQERGHVPPMDAQPLRMPFYLTLCIEIFKITNQGKRELRCILLVIHQRRFDVEVSLVFVESQA